MNKQSPNPAEVTTAADIVENEDFTEQPHSDIEDDLEDCEDSLDSTKKRNKTHQDTTEKPKEIKKDSLAQFNDYLKCEGEFNFNLVSKCSAKEISTYLEALLEHFYKNFDDLDCCKNDLHHIYKKTRYTVKSKAAFIEASENLFNQEFSKISKNSNWSDVVMFGSLLCELLPYHNPGYFEVTKQLNAWIMELVNCSADGSEYGLIAFMLILWKLTKIFNPLRGSYDQLLKVLRILMQDGDAGIKKLEIRQFLEQAGYLNLEDYESLEKVKYDKETASSQKCKKFEEFLHAADDHTLFNVAMFTDITDNEIEFFARKFVDVGIQEPQKMKFLVYTAYRFQQIVSHIRRIEENIVKNIDAEIEVMRKSGGKGKVELLNFAKFIGESYFYELGLIPSKTLTNWLSLLTELGETDMIFKTLMLCDGLYKTRDRENFDKFFEPLGDLCAVVKDEMKRVREQFDVDDMDSYIKYQESRRYQPTDGAKMISNFNFFLSEFSKGKTVNFDFLSLYEFKYFNSIDATNAIMREVASPAANAILVAEFFKSFFEFSVKLGKFVVELKTVLLSKVAEMPIDRPDEMIRIGKLIGELRNLTIIEKYPQDKWLDMIESLKPTKNVKIMEIYLEVLKVMMYNLYIHDEGKYMTYLKTIKAIDTSDPNYHPKMKSKIYQIIHNSIPKKFDKSAKFCFIRMKSGSRFDGIPKDIPETSPTDFDLHDFVKFYFLSAINNPYCIENYLKSRKFLSVGQQGPRFGVILNKLMFERFTAITDQVSFDEHEATTALKFILMTNSRSIYRENSIATFLQNILDFEDFDGHKECLRTLVRMLMKARFNLLKRADSKAIFCLWRKVQGKFTKTEHSGGENESDEVEIWHILDFQGQTNDQGSTEPESIEPSQLAWSFTENYKANQQKNQNIVEKATQPAKNMDCLAKNFKDFTQNFHEIQHPGRKVQKIEESQDIQPSTFCFTILSEDTANLQPRPANSHQRPSQVSTNYSQGKTRVDRKGRNAKTERDSTRDDPKANKRNQKPNIEWSVTRGDLKDRNELQDADLPNIKKRFNPNSPLYQGTSQSGGRKDEMRK